MGPGSSLEKGLRNVGQGVTFYSKKELAKNSSQRGQSKTLVIERQKGKLKSTGKNAQQKDTAKT